MKGTSFRNNKKIMGWEISVKYHKIINIVFCSVILQVVHLIIVYKKCLIKLLRPVAGYTLYGHKTNDYIRRELRITGILDKIDEYRRNWLFILAKNATKPNPF